MRTTILLLLLCFTLSATAQNRKYIGNFSQFRQYYSPALTGFDGSQVKTLYRNQWTGIEDAPKTIALAAELNLSDFSTSKGYRFESQERSVTEMRHNIGLLLLRDSFGPYAETQVNLSYGAGLPLSEALMLHWGGAITYTSLGLDGNKLTLDEQADPRYTDVLNRNSRSGKADLNLGLTLSGRSFYLGYAMQDATEGKVLSTGDEFINEENARKHVGMAGVRKSLSPSLAFTLNALYLHDKINGSTTEAQLKGIFQDMFWAGAGYRNKLAITAMAGFRLKNLQISYLYEAPAGDADAMNKPTNEITLAYRIKADKSNYGQATFW